MTTFSRFDLTVSPWVFEVLTHLWQSTAVALAIVVLVILGKGLSARTRRTLAWIAVAKFMLPAAWLVSLVEQAGGAPKSWLASDALLVPMKLAPASSAKIAAAPGMPVTKVLAVIWIAGSTGLLACWIARAMRARRRILAGATPAPDALVKQVRSAAARAGLPLPPRCAMVAPDHGPGLVGVAAPVLILPCGLAEALPSAELDAILVHECVHLQQRDNLWSAVRAAFVALLWFNPIAWLLNRAIGIETEKTCDERVLEITGDAEAYASSIVGSVRHTLGMVRPGFSGVATPPVLGRIKAILAYPARRERPLARRLVLLLGVGLVALSGRAGSIAAESSKPAPTPSAPTSTAAAPAEQSGATKPPRYKVGTVTIKFVGPANVSEQAVRDAMQIRSGGEFDETILDRDMRSLYRTGWFKFIEAKHEPVDGSTFNLVFLLTPKSVDGTTTPADPEPAAPASGAGEPPAKPSLSKSELDDAKRKLDAANVRLKRLREDRASALAQEMELKEASKPTTTPSVERQPGPEATSPSALPAVATRPPESSVSMQVYDIQSLDRVPTARFQARPRYPFEMRRTGVNGEVVVDFIVDDKGDVISAFALRSSRAEFESAAVEAVSRWKFRPGRKDGRDVHTHMQVPIVFTLNEK